MKTTLFVLLSIALVGAGCNKSTRSNSATADTSSAASDYTATNNATPNASPATANTTNSLGNSADRMSNDLRGAANSASNAIGSAASNVATTARMTQWKLNADDIQSDLIAHREIVRTKDTAAGAPTGNADKSVLESLVKSRLEADSAIASLKLSADADKDGAVKLTGKARSADEVGRAITLALDTEGVTKVTSKIKLDPDAGR